MTPDQRAALEILLDARDVLDTDTQLMPLIRFVLFGTTGTVESDAESFVMIKRDGNTITARCHACGKIIAEGDATYPGVEELVFYGAVALGFCPHCHAKFK